MARTSMNLVDVMAWLYKNTDRLKGIRIANVYQYNDSIIIKLKGIEPKVLVLEGARRIHLSKRIRPLASKLTQFVLVARKEIKDKIITDLSLVNNDRIVKIALSNNNSIVVELLPRGIIALLDHEDKIMVATSYLKTKDRIIKKGLKYTPPPLAPTKLTNLNATEVHNAIKSYKDLIRGLIRGLGIPGELAEEVIFRSGLKPDMKPDEIVISDISVLIEEITNVMKESFAGKGYLVLKNGASIEADPFEPRRFEEIEGYVVRPYDDFNDALDDHFIPKGYTEGNEYQKLLTSINKAREIIQEYKGIAKKLRDLAEKIAMKYNDINKIIECARSAYERGGWDEVKRCQGVTSVSPSKGTYLISFEDISVEVNIKDNIDKLIIKLYAKAGEAESKAKRAAESLRSIESKLKEIEIKNKIKEIETLISLRKRKWYEKYHWILTRNGFLAIGGKNAEQNESIVRKYLEDNDLFLHADIHGAPVVILKTAGSSPSLDDIYDAAFLTAIYSKAWKEGLGSVRVWWVRGNQVSKSPPSGEYLAKGSFMIYGKKNYLKPIELKLSLGISLDEEGIPMVIVGPEDLIRVRSLAYVVVVPGNMKVSEAAKEIKERLSKIVAEEDKYLILAMPQKEIEEKLPGRVRIIYVRKGSKSTVFAD
jgi:predicted ribosome quality control (RQC) complex YloA/Tae2 family protein